MALISLFENIIKIEFAPKFERIKPENVTYNRNVYPFTLKEFMKKFRKKEFGKPAKIGVVWGTTRHSPTDCKHAGYISDAMYIPELIQKLQKINREVIFKSYLDIDINEEKLKECNFILCGDGEVNYVVSELLKFVEDAIEIKYEESDKPFFMGKTSRVKHHMYGVVHLLKNPWNGNRFILHLGGIGPIGTIASFKWLCDMLKESSLPDSPFVVVKGKEKEYPENFNGYEKHCKECCRIKEVIDGDEKVYWKGKVSNVTAIIQIYP